MVSGVDIYRVAKLYLEQFGENVSLEAAKKFDEMTAKSDIDGRNVWRRIGDAIKDLDNSIPNKTAM